MYYERIRNLYKQDAAEYTLQCIKRTKISIKDLSPKKNFFCSWELFSSTKIAIIDLKNSLENSLMNVFKKYSPESLLYI